MAEVSTQLVNLRRESAAVSSTPAKQKRGETSSHSHYIIIDCDKLNS